MSAKSPMHLHSKEVIARLRDELEQARQKADYWEVMAMTDDLTGLHNRRLLGNLTQTVFDRRQNASGDMTLLFIDLDDFGQLNKKYGDDVGDEALRILAAGIKRHIRQDDIAIRKGGDEFVIILVGVDENQANEIVLKRIQRMLDGDLAITIGRERVLIRGSVGVFPYDRAASPFENIKAADIAMRDQKQLRKKAGSIRVTEPNIHPL